MSTQNEYTDTLKQIKEIEEAGAKELIDAKKTMEAEVHALEEESARSIAATRERADVTVATEVDQARREAQAEANEAFGAAQKESDKVMLRKLDKKDLKKVIDEIILAEFREA